jgi:hypothetical protein
MSASPAAIPKRMKRLPPRLRLAHLRALLRQEQAGSEREGLIALLREQLAAHAKADRTI